MTAFRIIEPFQVFLDLSGNVDSGGSLAFYQAGTTTPQDVFGDKALTVNNGPTVALGTDGRPVVDVWGQGSYRVRQYAADGTLVIDRDNIEIPGGSGATIPTPISDEFLTNDGAVLSWAAIRQLPDPTGESDKILSNDGSNFLWIAQPASVSIPDGGISQDSTSFTIGKLKVQTGSGTATASGAHTTSANVSFDTVYSTLLHVSITLKNSSVTSEGYNPIAVITNSSSTGFTVVIDINAGNSQPGISIPINFDYVAYGIIS